MRSISSNCEAFRRRPRKETRPPRRRSEKRKSVAAVWSTRPARSIVSRCRPIRARTSRTVRPPRSERPRRWSRRTGAAGAASSRSQALRRPFSGRHVAARADRFATSRVVSSRGSMAGHRSVPVDAWRSGHDGLEEISWDAPVRRSHFQTETQSAQRSIRKCSFTFATICGSVSLSTVSISTVRPDNVLDRLRRSLSSSFASPGPKIRRALGCPS